MKDSFRVGRVQLSLHSVEREIGETLGSSSKNSPLYFSIKNSLSILSRCILDTLEWNFGDSLEIRRKGVEKLKRK